MPFIRAQTLLRRLPCFTFLYKVSCVVYDLLIKIQDFLYYTSNFSEKAMTIRKILPYTMVGRKGLLVTYDICSSVKVKGCFVECGVARGGCAALMATLAKDKMKMMWMFDSFEGLPEPTKEDEYNEIDIAKARQFGDRSLGLVLKGYCLGTLDEVQKLFAELGLYKVSMIKGWFEDTLPKYKDMVGDIAVLRIDADWYESTKCCLENLYDNVVVGGYVIIDDYETTIGCKKAVDEFLDVELHLDGRGGCYFIKGE